MKTLGTEIGQPAREIVHTGDGRRGLVKLPPRRSRPGFGGIGLAVGAALSLGIPLLDLWLRSGDEAGPLTDRINELVAASRRVADVSKLAADVAAGLVARCGEASEAVCRLAFNCGCSGRRHPAPAGRRPQNRIAASPDR